MAADEVVIPALLQHQVEPYASEARVKLNCWGRRAGKSVFDLHCAILGHGPEDQGIRRWKGLIHGLDVLWVEPNHQQTNIVWRDEIRPRFKGKAGVTLTEAVPHILSIQGAGNLYFCSAEAIDTVRGLGKNLGGVILNECAHMDLEYVWRDVVFPMLTDRYGWAIKSSTPNGGHDGNPEHRVPSFFNVECDEVEAGRKPGWVLFHRTARDNPKISPQAFTELVQEYPSENDPKCQQEVYAKRIRGGTGLAFAEWDDQEHVTDFQPELLEGWRWMAGLDWGRTSSGSLVLYADGPKQHRVVRWDWEFRDKAAYDVGYLAGQYLQRFPRPEMIVYDSAMGDLGGASRSIIQLFGDGLGDALGKSTIPLVAVPKIGSTVAGRQKTSRQTRKLLMHEALKVVRDEAGKVTEWGHPKTQFHREAKNCIRTIPKLVLDEKDTEDVNTDGDDHTYDACTYPWLMRLAQVKGQEPVEHVKHRFFGYDENRQKIRPGQEPPRPVRDRHHQPRRGPAIVIRGDQ